MACAAGRPGGGSGCAAEAEVYAMMEAVKEGRLRLWIAEEAGIEVSYPL